MSENKEWINSYRQKWMTDAQWECYCLLADLYRGFHHMYGKAHPCGDNGITYNELRRS